MILFCTFGLLFQTFILIYESVWNNCFKLIYTANVITILKYGYKTNCYLDYQIDGIAYAYHLQLRNKQTFGIIVNLCIPSATEK